MGNTRRETLRSAIDPQDEDPNHLEDLTNPLIPHHTRRAIAIHRAVLDTRYTLLPGCPLEAYFLEHLHLNRPNYTLEQILFIIRDAVIRDDLFINNNPHIIKCNPPMAAAFQQRFLYIHDIRPLALNQMARIPGQGVGSPPSQLGPSFHINPAANSTPMHNDRRYIPSPMLLLALCAAPAFTIRSDLTSLTDIIHLTSSYIVDRPDVLTGRHNRIAWLGSTPLGMAFGTAAIHRSQLMHYLLSAITVVTNFPQIGNTEMRILSPKITPPSAARIRARRHHPYQNPPRLPPPRHDTPQGYYISLLSPVQEARINIAREHMIDNHESRAHRN